MNDYFADFKLLLISILFSFNDPNDHTAVLNKLITDSIADRAPIKKSDLHAPSSIDQRSKASYSKDTFWAKFK